MAEQPIVSHKERTGASGIGVDVYGAPVIDPTKNVLANIEAESKRQDDLRMAAKELSDSNNLHQKEMGLIQAAHLKEISDLRERHQNEIGRLREEHQAGMAEAESGRLNSIRQVDREEVAKTAVAANTAIATLAKQTTDLATTLQKQVSDTATAAEARSSAQYNDTTKRLQAVELALSEGKGKQQVSDPAIERMANIVEKLASGQATFGGERQGISSAWYVLGGVVALIMGLLTIGALLVSLTVFMNRQASPAYVPAPPATMLPTTAPQTPVR